jgi:hypothetical protein
VSTRKGIKGQKNTPYMYDEVKEKKTIMVTPTAWDILKKKAIAQEISISEMAERLFRGLDG